MAVDLQVAASDRDNLLRFISHLIAQDIRPQAKAVLAPIGTMHIMFVSVNREVPAQVTERQISLHRPSLPDLKAGLACFRQPFSPFDGHLRLKISLVEEFCRLVAYRIATDAWKGFVFVVQLVVAFDRLRRITNRHSGARSCVGVCFFPKLVDSWEQHIRAVSRPLPMLVRLGEEAFGIDAPVIVFVHQLIQPEHF